VGGREWSDPAKVYWGKYRFQATVSGLLSQVSSELSLLRNRLMEKAIELKPSEESELVRILKEPLEAELKAIKGTAAKAQRKALAQGKELADLQAAHTRTLAELRRMNLERDALRALLGHVAPGVAKAWAMVKQAEQHQRWFRPEPQGGKAFTDIPQTHETHGD